jgi:hypothetical protein
MTNIVVLNRQTHRDLSVKPAAAAPRNFVAVVVGEFSHLVAHYPILISKEAETGAFYCGAMLGIDPGENLFAGEKDIYRPLNLQRGPFFAAGSDLAIDLDAPAVGSGERLFGEDGEPTAYLTSIMALLRDLKPGLEQTKAFLAILARLSLIAPLDVELSFDDGSQRTLEGLYSINAEALRALSDADVLTLYRRGYLELCHLMLASLRQVPVLAARKNAGLRQGVALAGTFA